MGVRTILTTCPFAFSFSNNENFAKLLFAKSLIERRFVTSLKIGVSPENPASNRLLENATGRSSGILESL